MEWIVDTHAHYDDEAFDGDRKELLSGLRSHGIGTVVNIGASMASCRTTLALAAEYPFIYAAVGVHPNETGELSEGDMDWLKAAAKEKKTVAIGDCEPDLAALQEAIRRRSRFCLVKLSPMLDIGEALRALPHTAEVHAVSVQGECKELLLVMTRTTPEHVAFHCVNLDSGQPEFCFTPAEEEQAACSWAETPGRFLYEPNPSLMKCQPFRCLAARYGLRKFHPNSHLYTADEWRENFPGRTFVVEAACGFGKRELRDMLKDLRQANLTVRNFPATVATLRQRLKLKEGGDTYLFATTTADGHHVLLRCHKHES